MRSRLSAPRASLDVPIAAFVRTRQQLARIACGAVILTMPGPAWGRTTTQHFQELAAHQRAQSKQQQAVEEELGRLARADADFDSTATRDDMAPHMQAVYDGLHYLLSDSLREQFVGLSSDSLRGEWMRRYWALRDPTPTTPENEFRDEHRRRVQLARRSFRCQEPPGWDDRGAFMILYGPPQAVSDVPADVRIESGFIPARKYWFYDDGVVVPFERRNPAGTKWTFGISTQKISSRIDLLRDAQEGQVTYLMGYGVAPTMYDGDRPSLADLDPFRASQIALSQAAASELLEQRRERVVLAGPPRSPLWFVFDTDVFADRASSGARLETHVQLLLADLQFEPRGSVHEARFGVEGVLMNAELYEVARDTYEETVTAANLEATRVSRLIPGQLAFSVEPGMYRLAVRVVDLTSTAETSYTTRVQVPEFPHERLALSDIELASVIVPADERATRFAKNGRTVLPHPIAAYQDAAQLTAYLEIYGLQQRAGAVGRYRVSYEIVAHKRRRHEGWFTSPGTVPVVSVTSSFTATATTPDPIEELRIDIATLEEATYDFTVTVHDLVGNQRATATTTFSVLRD